MGGRCDTALRGILVIDYKVKNVKSFYDLVLLLNKTYNSISNEEKTVRKS